jgi:phosphoglycerate kinase
MAKKTIDQVDVAGKRVLMRVDFNVPLDESGKITDDRRIAASLLSIQSVISRGGRLILMSHLGRPEGKGFEAEFSLKPAAEKLSQLLRTTVVFPDTDCTSDGTRSAIEGLANGGVVLLENLRFHPGEESNDARFAARLASYGDLYCNDAFGTAHRDHASMVGVPEQMKGKPRVAGLLLRGEIKFLSEVLSKPQKPFIAVLGGAKISDKLGVIRNLMGKVDAILVGGAMAYTFLKALDQEIGSSKAQLGMVDDARKMLDLAGASHTDLILPTDHVCGREVTSHTPVRIVEGSIEKGWMGLDIGPKTLADYTARISKGKTIIWNGPMGVAEVSPFDAGTRGVAEAIAKATGRGALTVVGGGDSAAAVEALGLADRFSHVSTGGGASLQMLEGKPFRSVSLLDEA